MGDNLKKNMLSALTWSSVNVFGLQFIQLLIGIVLARNLTPEHFGEIGVLFIFIGLSTVLIDGGFGQGLIRKQHTIDTDYSSVFFFNLTISILLYVILYIFAPLIANLFKIPTLTTTSRVLFLIIFIYPFYLIQQVILTKALDYKALAIINIASVGLSGTIAIILAKKGFGVWALVAQQLLFHFSKMLFFPFYSKWKPKLQFSIETIKELWKFSISLLGQTTLNVIFNNIYIMLIGLLYPLKQVGYFTQANKYSETVNSAAQSILFYSAFPIFSRIQENTERLRNMYRKLTTSIVTLTFPVYVFLIIAAEPIIIILITAKWLPSVLLFQLLVTANIFTPTYHINTNLLNAKGESEKVLKLEIFKKTLITVSIFISFSFQSIVTLLIGLILANTISYFASMTLIKRSLSHFYRHQMKDFLLVLIIAVLLGIICYFINFITISYILKLILQFIVFFGLYLLAIKFLFPERLYEIKALIKNTKAKT